MNSSTASFEVLPFRGDGEAQSEEIRRRMGGISPRSSGAIGRGRGLYQGPNRPPYGLRRPIGRYGPIAVQAGAAPDYTQAPAGGAVPSEQIRWVQFALNQIMNARLPTDGIASSAFRAALREFQGQRGLPVSGFAGPDTIAALQSPASDSTSTEWEIVGRNEAISRRGSDFSSRVTTPWGGPPQGASLLAEQDELALALELLEAETDAEFGAILKRVTAEAKKQAQRAAQAVAATASSIRKDPWDAAGKAAGALAKSVYARHTGDLAGAQLVGQNVHYAVSLAPSIVKSQTRALADRLRGDQKQIRELYEIAPDLALQKAVDIVRRAALASAAH